MSQEWKIYGYFLHLSISNNGTINFLVSKIQITLGLIFTYVYLEIYLYLFYLS